VRILFQAPYPGYLRFYGATITLLADRGHTVLLSYDMPDKRRDPTAAEVESRGRVELVPPIPDARRRGESAIEKLRLMTDYLRYLDPRFSDSVYLRRRLDSHLAGGLRALKRAPSGLRAASPAVRALLALERLVPSDRGVERAIAATACDAVVVTPLIGRTVRGIRQTDTVKAARGLGIPVGLAVASWDHLTSKGLVKALPDRAFVWNEFQVREAVEHHRLPADRVVVTGAHPFDTWFERRPSTTREDFLGRARLDPSAQYVLYVGSSPSMAPSDKEIPFVLAWIEALRRSGDALLEDLGVLVRPHPGNVGEWAGVRVPDARTAIVPRERPSLPMAPVDEALYFDSIHFASAVVGINTSAMIESFIQRRPVLTIRTPEFRSTQDGTLHFRYLLPSAGGPLRSATSVEEHLEQLRQAVADPERDGRVIGDFVRSFLRPHGLDRPSTPILADAIEALARRE
jgi:hypothetical protein